MADTTTISWCDHTFNGWVGCMKVSPACDGCYAEMLMDTRYGRVEWGAPGKGVGTRDRTSVANWKQPIRWDRDAAAAGEPRFVFCSSLADVFDNAVPTEWRRDLFDLIRATPHLTWLLLTKRPGNIVKLWAETFADESGPPVVLTPDFWPRNAAIGCTVATQEEADRDIPKLLAAKDALTPAFAFLSMEPLLGPVNLRQIAQGPDLHLDALTGMWTGSATFAGGLQNYQEGLDRLPTLPAILPAVDWVISGGETNQGPHKARPSHPEWFRLLRDQCAATFTAYHHKQNGESCALRGELIPVPSKDIGWISRDGAVIWNATDADFRRMDRDDDRLGRESAWWSQIVRVGKTKAGRLLDGVEHNARPSPIPTGVPA